MNSFRILRRRKTQRGGFSLAETALSIGILSCGLLSLVPLLYVGLKTAAQARSQRTCAHIARELVERARQGDLAAGTLRLDDQGDILDASQFATYTAQGASQPAAQGAGLTRFTLRITPVGAPGRARVYAVVYPTPPVAAR